MRTTRTQLDGIAARLADALGHPYLKYADRVAVMDAPQGAWWLDYSPAYGGWVLAERVGVSGEGRPLGDRRRSAGDMWDVCHFALAVLWEQETYAPDEP